MVGEEARWPACNPHPQARRQDREQVITYSSRPGKALVQERLHLDVQGGAIQEHIKHCPLSYPHTCKHILTHTTCTQKLLVTSPHRDALLAHFSFSSLLTMLCMVTYGTHDILTHETRKQNMEGK